MTPQNFDLVLFITILPGNKTFPFVKIYPFVIVDFYSKWKTFKKALLDLNTLYDKTILYQWI